MSKISQLAGKNIVVYDCEIKHVIDQVNITWNDHHKMGLSVACLFDYETMDYVVYLERDLQNLCNRLNGAEMVVGFNTEGFDEKLLRGLGGDLTKLKNWDMLYWCRRATGWTDRQRFPSGLKLDDVLEGTFGKEHMKTDHGSQAPIMWREGRHGECITYCLADVKRERMLFEQLVGEGHFTTATHGKKYVDQSGLAYAIAPF